MTPEDNFEEKKENGLKKKRPRVGDANPSSSSFYQPRTNYDNRGTDNHPYQQRSYSNNRSNDNYQNRDNYRSQDNYRGGDNYRNRDQNQNRNNIYQNRQSGGNYGNSNYQNRSNNYQNRDNNYQNRQSGGNYGNSNYQNRSNNYQNRDNNYQNRQGGGNYGNNSYQNRNNDNRGQYRPNNDQNNRQGGYNQRPYNNHQQQQRPYNKQRPYNNQQQQQRQRPVVTPVKYKENVDPDTEIRLNKYLANAGVCSRREADAFIQAGVVKVNGAVITELGTKVKRSDEVFFHEQPVRIESKVYVLLNKPKNCVTTSDDPQNRMTVMDLVKNACPERIYPVGRLDRNTTGVLLLTNDGDLASKLMHPKFLKKKIYQVKLDRDVAIEDMQAIADGVVLDDGEIHADSIAYVSEENLNEVGIEIHSGRNRVVRRIFEKLGYQIKKLDRVYFAGLTKKNLSRGKWRYLSANEVNMLRMGAFE